ncbi:Stp1/IreP family PP2C-type Ser/Thr phosphatase [Aureibacillus halotolerans]|uniref:protein-serine/threonine phosphatase n=1 Tax=Aureibacillus halotolerans TaxID=1508390 RepID=A0A4R6U9B8_9BACI|nr:Stp1/IreP family PP2C-type Ser/Thr phosphatase [Aureibacillus halotolerans]TDQ42372.1 serine/threonine protein phosphatase PrpC [Aureibacillus halotolerans]
MKTFYSTNVGIVREHNEDSVAIEGNDTECFAIVADGMGGHRAGDVASAMAVEELMLQWQERPVFGSPTVTEAWIQETVQKVNVKMHAYAQTHKECNGMGTTLISAICTPTYVTLAHIGDSRGYVKRQSLFRQVTDDHTLVNELVRSGELSKEAAEYHPRKNIILRALGTDENVLPDVQSFEWEQGEYVLLCSDGLSNKVTDQELDSLLSEEKGLDQKAEAMIAAANLAGGEDNISVALVYNEPCEEGRRVMG